MARLPIRVRVTLAFTAAVALVLAGFGTFVYLRTAEQLDESITDTLEVRVADVAARPASSGVLDQPLDPEDSFVQVIGVDGALDLTTDQLDAPVLGAGESGTRVLERLDGLDGRVRVLARPIGGGRVAVAGATLEDRDDSLANLALLLTLGGPAALALAAAAGYWAAGRALRPVERMRSQASAIGRGRRGERLVLPTPDDELRRLGATLNEMLDRLEGAVERERRFVDDASHELRTPLALHKTELEVAQRYAADESELRAAIASGIAEVDRLAQLADDLLVVARSDGGAIALDCTELDARELLEGVATRHAERVSGVKRRLAVDIPESVAVTGDRLRIEQALTNLVENALRHGGGTITLAARPADDGSAILCVGDEGSGFPDGFLPRAFERFSRGDEARGRGGSGLGLAIVAAIAEAHAGRAAARNRPDGGAEVWLELPSLRFSS